MDKDVDVNNEKDNNEEEEKENKDEGDSYTSRFLTGIWNIFGMNYFFGNKDDGNQSSIIQEGNGSSVLKYEGLDERDQLIQKLHKQRSLKPEIIKDEFDTNYVKPDSFTTDNEEENNKKIFLFCPITEKIMEEPVITPYGTTYEKSAILDWIEKNKNDYVTRKSLTKDMLVENYFAKTAIKEYNESLKLL